MVATSRDPCLQPARLLARRLKRRQLGAQELVRAHLERIERLNPSIGAVVSLDPEGALERARAADAALAHGDGWGPLHGVPMTLKDGNDVAGLRTTLGSPALDRAASADGAVAARLRAAGAILIGHTNVPPFLGDFQSANPIFGRTANPWRLERTAGGSSGGAAAALAAGLAPLEVGSDLSGSVRLPAAFCGVYGLKTTEHRVPLTGFFRFPFEVPRSVRILSCLGPMARDLGDLELVLRLISGPDGHDGDVPAVPLGARRRCSLPELRVAAAPTIGGAPVAAGPRGAVEAVASALAAEGARVEERLPDLDWQAHAELFVDLVTAITGLFSPDAELREEQRSLAWYLSALERRDRIVAAWHRFFEGCDALLLPATMTTAFPHCEPGTPLAVDGAAASYWDQAAVLVPANLAGLPALVAPAGLDDQGLPLAVQLVGAPWSELRLVEIAAALERAGILPGFRPPVLD